MKITYAGNEITVSGRKVTFPQTIDEVIVVEDRVIVLLLADDYKEDDPQRQNNIIALDDAGNLLWRIERPGYNILNQQGEEIQGGYWGIRKLDNGRIVAFIPIGYELNVDLDTGKVSNPMFVK